MEVTDRYVETAGVSIHYAEVENGLQPMILLHGIGMDWRVWQSVSRRLAPHFHLFMVDLRGHGNSAKPAHGYSLADYASDVEQLIDAIGLSDVCLVGSSLGGMVAAILEESSAVVSSRVLVDPPLRRGSGPKRPLFEQLLLIKESGVSREEQCQLIFRALLGEIDGAGNSLIRYMAEAWTSTAPGVLEDALTPVEKPEQIDAAIAAIDAPVLILRGNQDRGSVLPEAVSKHALSLLIQGSEQYFAGSGHAIHGSEPARFVDAVVRFVQRESSATTP